MANAINARRNIFSGAIGSDGSPTYFMIYPPSSSLHGRSIAILAFVTVTNVFGTTWSPRHLTFGLLAILSLVAVNLTRLSLIGVFPSYFSLIHDLPGSAIAASLSLALVVAIPLIGVIREPFVRT